MFCVQVYTRAGFFLFKILIFEICWRSGSECNWCQIVVSTYVEIAQKVIEQWGAQKIRYALARGELLIEDMRPFWCGWIGARERGGVGWYLQIGHLPLSYTPFRVSLTGSISSSIWALSIHTILLFTNVCTSSTNVVGVYASTAVTGPVLRLESHATVSQAVHLPHVMLHVLWNRPFFHH